MYMRRRSSWKRKSKRRPWLLIILLILIGGPIGLELLTRATAQLTGLNSQFTSQPSGPSAIVQAYQLGFLSPEGQPYEQLPQQGDLLALRSPLMGYRLRPQQQSQFWTINPQGFRDDEAVSPQKPEGEVRIFVLGGSAAFGELTSSNQALFTGKLEALLNQQIAAQAASPDRFQPAVLPYRADEVERVLARPARIPDRTYRVINSAVPGYASGNELAMLVQQLAAYNPDILLVLDSYPDLLLPSAQVAADIPGLDQALAAKPKSWSIQATEAAQAWFNSLYLVRAIQRYVLQAPAQQQVLARSVNLTTADASRPLAESLPKDEAELNRRVASYRRNLQQMIRWSTAARKQVLIGLQPEITGKKAENLTTEEAAIVSQLGSAYVEQVQTAYDKLAAAAQEASRTAANARVLNLYRLYETYDQRAFQSPTELTDDANTVLAERLYEAIVDQLAITPKPYGA